MSEKKKTDILRLLIFSSLASAAVILVWISENKRFSHIPSGLLIAAGIAFFAEIAILLTIRSKNAVLRGIKIILLFVLNFSLFSAAVVYCFSSALILQPHFDEKADAELRNENIAEEIFFEGENGIISGWFYNAAGKSAPTVLYFYGNYETAATRMNALIKNYKNSAFSGCNFAVFDYPAYGKSEGNCSDEALLRFSLEAFDELQKRTDRIIALGYSVGTGPAVYLASQRDLDALILYAPYSDGNDLYNNIIDIFHGPLERLISFNIKSKEYASSVKEDTLILASEKDELIPYLSSSELADKFGDNCTFIKTPEIGHNDFLGSVFVKEKTARFIKESVMQ